jgi:hypothetical protein
MCKITSQLHGYPKKHGLSINWIGIELFNRFGIDISESSLQAYFSPDNKTPLPAYLIVPICRICNNDFSILDIIEADAKRTAISISCEPTPLNYKSVAKLAKEAGEAIATVAGAIEDKIVTHDESKDCVKELLDLQSVTTGLLMQFNN